MSVSNPNPKPKPTSSSQQTPILPHPGCTDFQICVSEANQSPTSQPPVLNDHSKAASLKSLPDAAPRKSYSHSKSLTKLQLSTTTLVWSTRDEFRRVRGTGGALIRCAPTGLKTCATRSMRFKNPCHPSNESCRFQTIPFSACYRKLPTLGSTDS